MTPILKRGLDMLTVEHEKTVQDTSELIAQEGRHVGSVQSCYHQKLQLINHRVVKKASSFQSFVSKIIGYI